MRIARPHSLGARIAVSAAAAIVVATLVLGGAVLAFVDRGLRGSVDDGLRTRAAEIAGLAQTTPKVIAEPGALDSAVAGRALLVEVIDARGRLRARSLALGGRVLPVDDLVRSALRSSTARYADRRLGGSSIRVYVTPLSLARTGNASGAVAVAADVSDLGDSLERTRFVTVLAAILAAVIGVFAALFLTRRAMRPLTRLTAAAETIVPSGDATIRLPAPGTGDEVARLADTLNRMLSAIETARDRERRFVADASHELRTPLTALRGNAEHALSHPSDPSVMTDIAADVERLAGTLDDLLALAREDVAASPTAAVAVDELARELVGREAGVELVASDPAVVLGDAPSLERALANLIQNARTHGPPGAVVEVRVERRRGRVLLSVDDGGEGLVGEAAEHAFERFWRGGSASGRSGSGLGLAIVRATADRHAGRVSSQRGRFTIDLPELSETSHRPSAD